MRHPYADFLHEVARPARYLGGEYLSVVKDDGIDCRVVLAFPDVYEIGMSHLGTKILYSALNRQPGIACERAFAPWVDLEAQLRARRLPLVSLETARPLSAFDVVGCSLQYELTYSNVLTLLDLGGIPLLAAERDERHPLVIGGGPTATHPEPMAPFFDAFFVGEAEAELPGLVTEWAAMRRDGRRRLDALAELAARYPVYVPALYQAAVDPATGLVVVEGPKDARAPRRIRRGLVADLDAFPFPTDSPVPYAEAVFDRAGVELARGCTEGCRFCQAGMIYRPVRERSPEALREAVAGNVARGGYDEAALTALSTADVSFITPLVRNLMGRLREQKVALSVSSLRAYGLSEELLAELASVRATGLTFAPEAGTQRMRDVVNKNVTEEHVALAAEHVFQRGWSRLKLYFMIGLPTEEDADISAIIDTGVRVAEIGRRHVGGAAEITVSVSSHVPKPHTPFQWCRMDDPDELGRKQALLRAASARSRPRVRLKVHDRGVSHVEGVLARGDRRVADAILAAWRDGARFDGWEELFDLRRWQRAFAASGVEPAHYLAALPTSARLPWDHIDVGLADDFLASEYRRALAGRLSPPCGKPKGLTVHHANLADAEADTRKLVCYECGIACDLSRMREDRLDHLRALGALAPAVPREVAQTESRKQGRRPEPKPQFTQGEGTRFRLRFTKLGRAAFVSHLDLMRLLARLLRRADLPVIHSLGFHPKPQLTFAPALGLGIASLGELVDVRLDADPPEPELLARLNEVSPDGIRFDAVRRVGVGSPSVAKVIHAADLAFWSTSVEAEVMCRAGAGLMAQTEVWAERSRKTVGGEGGGDTRRIDVRPHLLGFDVLAGSVAARLVEALGWSTGDVVTARIAMSAAGSVRPSELAALLGAPGAEVARLALVGLDGEGKAFDPFGDPPGGVVSVGGEEA